MVPGEVLLGEGGIALNHGHPVVNVDVVNTGDRPVQVGSHYHFAEANSALSFDRLVARGYRLNIPAGTSTRFEPGVPVRSELVALGGQRAVAGLNGMVRGALDG